MNRRFAEVQNTYTELVNQTFHFPQEDFFVKDGYLRYNNVDLKYLIEKYGTPLKYLTSPKIGMQINKRSRCLQMPSKSINTKAITIIAIAQRAHISASWWKRH
jgi:hypothetical protein